MRPSSLNRQQEHPFVLWYSVLETSTNEQCIPWTISRVGVGRFFDF